MTTWDLEEQMRHIERSAVIDAAQLGRLEAAVAGYLAEATSAGQRASIVSLRRRMTLARYRLGVGDEAAPRVSAIEALAVYGAAADAGPMELDAHIPTCLDGIDAPSYRSWRAAVRAGYGTRACLGRAQARGDAQLDAVVLAEEALAGVQGRYLPGTGQVMVEDFPSWQHEGPDPRGTALQSLVGYLGVTYAITDPRRAVLVLPLTASVWLPYLQPGLVVSDANAGQLLAA